MCAAAVRSRYGVESSGVDRFGDRFACINFTAFCTQPLGASPRAAASRVRNCSPETNSRETRIRTPSAMSRYLGRRGVGGRARISPMTSAESPTFDTVLDARFRRAITDHLVEVRGNGGVDLQATVETRPVAEHCLNCLGKGHSAALAEQP